MWCVPEVTEEFVERMEDVLELYAKPVDPGEPVVCLDERPVVLHDEARPARPMRAGKPARPDYEYVRCGTANIFCIVEPLTGRRLTHATKNRTGAAFAAALKKVSRRYQGAKTIHLIVDNLNTHRLKSLTLALGMEAGAALWKRFTVHYTPKHASWLNAAEMEASLVSRECLGRRRIASLARLKTEVSTWRKCADSSGRKIEWKFRVDDARRVFRYAGIITSRSEH
jgi:transposase